MTGDLLYLPPLEDSRNVVLIDAVRRELLGTCVEHVLRQPRQYVFGHVPAVVGVGAEFAVPDGHTLTSVRTGQVGKEIQIEVSPERRTVRGLGGGAGTDCQDLVRVWPEVHWPRCSPSHPGGW